MKNGRLLPLFPSLQKPLGEKEEHEGRWRWRWRRPYQVGGRPIAEERSTFLPKLTELTERGGDRVKRFGLNLQTGGLRGKPRRRQRMKEQEEEDYDECS